MLVLVQNQTLPRDLRVWKQCGWLRDQGFEVVAVCPASEEHPQLRLDLAGIEIHRFPLRPARTGAAGYAREYLQSLWRMRRIVRRLSRDRRFDIVHAANPPDLLLLTALPARRRGARLIFDQHDLVPELYLSRFARGRDLGYRLTRRCERLSYRLADVVIATNESYRRIALGRGGKHPEDVFVVRNGPDLDNFAEAPRDERLLRGKHHLLLYIGVMGPQDGIDHALRALALLKRRRSDWHAAIAGAGDAEPALRRLAHELELDGEVEFTGWLEQPELMRYLFSADVGLTPDPKSPLNDLSTLVKTTDYMAASCPVVAYDLTESRVSAGDAALYAVPNDEESYARCIELLLDDAQLREAMGRIGRERVERALSWQQSLVALDAAYRRALGLAAAQKPLEVQGLVLR